MKNLFKFLIFVLPSVSIGCFVIAMFADKNSTVVGILFATVMIVADILFFFFCYKRME